eukprot:4471593-Amphidinium_carterae.1
MRTGKYAAFWLKLPGRCVCRTGKDRNKLQLVCAFQDTPRKMGRHEVNRTSNPLEVTKHPVML